MAKKLEHRIKSPVEKNYIKAKRRISSGRMEKGDTNTAVMNKRIADEDAQSDRRRQRELERKQKEIEIKPRSSLNKLQESQRMRRNLSVKIAKGHSIPSSVHKCWQNYLNTLHINLSQQIVNTACMSTCKIKKNNRTRKSPGKIQRKWSEGFKQSRLARKAEKDKAYRAEHR